jgi:ABC-type transport system involved in multi-copper enzyme maturation permease subunit
MTFLPIVTRELSAASRRRATFWTRMIFAGVAVALAAIVLAFISVTQPRPGIGAGVFQALSGLGFAFCALAGVFLTADALSEEKREGTLGLLFLTDLRGYDVVFGKLFATSLTAFHGVLALFPVLALTSILGGVTAGEFWRMTLVFLNTLFLSLTAGLWVSTLSRDSPRAMAATVLLLLAIVILPPGLNRALSFTSKHLPPAILQFSPLWGWQQCFDPPYGTRPWDFWRCALSVQAMSWTFLLVAAALLTRVWQEGRHMPWSRATPFALTPARLARSAAERCRWMAPNPIRWLARRGPIPLGAYWLGFALLGGLQLLVLSLPDLAGKIGWIASPPCFAPPWRSRPAASSSNCAAPARSNCSCVHRCLTHSSWTGRGMR